MKTKNDKELILSRIKQHYNFKTDTELSDFLGVSKSTLSNWNKRNSIDYDLIFSKCEQIDKNWLLTGKEQEKSKISGHSISNSTGSVIAGDGSRVTANSTTSKSKIQNHNKISEVQDDYTKLEEENKLFKAENDIHIKDIQNLKNKIDELQKEVIALKTSNLEKDNFIKLLVNR